LPLREAGADRVFPTVSPLPRAGTAAAGAFQDCPTCPTMLPIPEGAFVMGQGAKEPDALPSHRVSIRAFALAQVPATVAEWKLCINDAGCRSMPRLAATDDRTPMHNLSWEDAQQYTGWMSRRTGRRYRLPSEAEWEYAARAGATTRYWWGNEIGLALANCADCGGPQDPHAPLPVGSFKPNAFGLHDMLGGVAQWTADCWFPNYRDAPTDGSAREARTCLQRVLRGGSFRSGRNDIALVARANYDSSVRYIVNGVRVARDLD
jgi:formylglycine-generating enzyme required for sulfatase activity